MTCVACRSESVQVLQSFPRDYEFAGSGRSQYQQIGNAVPPLLGKAVGRTISRFLDGERMPTPPEPQWRSASANRRIGSHGWAIPESDSFLVTMNVKVRPDHVWAATEQVEPPIG